MSLALVKSHLSGALAKLGTYKDAKSSPPQSEDNSFAIAWEYFVADFLCSLANKRKELAKKAAEEAGIISKPAEGATEVVYRSTGLQIIGQTKTAAKTLDKTVLNSELMKAIGAEMAQKIINKATKSNAPATTFSFVGEQE